MFRYVQFPAFSANVTMNLSAKLMLHGRKRMTNLYLMAVPVPKVQLAFDGQR
jgi:hypothetical protein